MLCESCAELALLLALVAVLLLLLLLPANFESASGDRDEAEIVWAAGCTAGLGLRGVEREDTDDLPEPIRETTSPDLDSDDER